MTDIVTPPDDLAERIAWARSVCYDRGRWAKLVSGKAVVKMAEKILIDAGLPVPIGKARPRPLSLHGGPDDRSSGSGDFGRGEDRAGSGWADGGSDSGSGSCE